jgi:hypothetical protein
MLLCVSAQLNVTVCGVNFVKIIVCIIVNKYCFKIKKIILAVLENCLADCMFL